MFVKISYQLNWNLERCGKFSHEILIFLWENFNISRSVEIVLHVPPWGLNLLGTGWQAFWGGKSLRAWWQKLGITIPGFGTRRYLRMTIRRHGKRQRKSPFLRLSSPCIVFLKIVSSEKAFTPHEAYCVSVCLSVCHHKVASISMKWNCPGPGVLSHQEYPAPTELPSRHVPQLTGSWDCSLTFLCLWFHQTTLSISNGLVQPNPAPKVLKTVITGDLENSLYHLWTSNRKPCWAPDCSCLLRKHERIPQRLEENEP